MSILNQLNENQRAAVEYIDGPSLIIAGAGTDREEGISLVRNKME